MSANDSSAELRGVPANRSATPFRKKWAWRQFALQVLVLLVIAAFFYYIVHNTLANMDRLGIHSGLGFLGLTAHFDISQHFIPYDETSTYATVFLVALLNTVALALICMVLSTLLGLIIGLCRLSSNPLLAFVATAYVNVIRNIPLLLQLFYWYFATLATLPIVRQSIVLPGDIYLNRRGVFAPSPIPQQSCAAFGIALVVGLAIWWFAGRRAHRHRLATGHTTPLRWLGPAATVLLPALVWLVLGAPFTLDMPTPKGFNVAGGMSMNPEFAAMILALTIYNAAFIAELVRGGIQSVAKGQTEAATALGLKHFQIYSKITVPQALRAIIPPLSTQYMQLLKATSLGAAIAYPDLMLVFAGTALAQTSQPIEIMVITMLAYLVLGLGIAAATNYFNRRVQIRER
ncbi:MAG TPA: ABC transporter permease subunit [Devosiaceae bacterium]|jgi:general L-amino acid transport system permease protein